MIYIMLLTCVKMEVKSHLERKQFPQARRLMMVFDVDIIISEPIQTASSWLNLFCALYSSLQDFSFRYAHTLTVRR